MSTVALVLIIFILGYAAIALEHYLHLNKSAVALITGVLCWMVLATQEPVTVVMETRDYSHYLHELTEGSAENISVDPQSENTYRGFVLNELALHLHEISQVLFFLLGAMTIVELIDSHKGFTFITRFITTRKPKRILLIVGILAFFLSALLDNLTTTLIMIALVGKLITNKNKRLYFTGLIIIAANAGGAWSPIGDVTTTMLWIGGQISTVNIIQSLFLPSIVSFIVPLILIRSKIGEQLEEVPGLENAKAPVSTVKGGKYVTIAGLAALIAVPIIKTYTHLPPYMGMMIGLGIVWILAEWIHRHGKESERKALSVPGALARVDVSSILFFMGILLAVASLETAGMLLHAANVMNENLSDVAVGQFLVGHDVIVLTIGLMSSIVDNVPLVAATMGMYSLNQFPMDSRLWEFIAYCAGTGGSLLIIGSAAGVAAMGIEKINFVWYLKKISFAALLGYLAGALAYLLTDVLNHL